MQGLGRGSPYISCSRPSGIVHYVVSELQLNTELDLLTAEQGTMKPRWIQWVDEEDGH